MKSAVRKNRTRTVALLAVPGVQLLDVSGPLDVFAEANAQVGERIYQLALIAPKAGPLRSSCGVRLLPDRLVSEPVTEKIDTILIAGCPRAAEVPADAGTIEWLRRHAPKARRFGSVCSGAFYLAEAGLLDGRHVTTHWAVADQLAARYPTIIVDKDAIHVADGPVRTAAGVTAGLDLALALVEEDLGRTVAMQVAGQLVMFFKRPGGQMQFSREGQALPAGRGALQELQRWITANPGLDHSIGNLARRMDLSPRHFARLFRDQIGITPATWVETVRVAAARKMLESGDPPKQVAVASGFADADTLRRAFARHVGVTPAEYRKRFSRLAA